MFIRAGKRPLPMTKQMRGEQFRVMGVFRAVKVDQRRDSAARCSQAKRCISSAKKVLPTPDGPVSRTCKPCG